MSVSRLSKCAGLLILSSSCVPLGDQPMLGTTEQEAGCIAALCGNAAKLFGPFYELDMTMTLHSPLGGYRITSFTLGDTELDLSVTGFKVAGRPRGGGLPIENDDLVGAVFVIEQAGTTNQAQVTIDEVGSITYYEGGNDADVTLPTFKLSFQVMLPNDELSFSQPVCPAGSNPYFDRHALLFTGNRYSFDGGVSASGAVDSYPWFNVACNDTGQWKAALFRLVSAAEAPAFPSDPVDYEAAVRSIRADYCGNGITHTVLGADVDWENRGGWLTKTDGRTLEAVWDESGAICLSKPRLADVDPDALECEIRRCNRWDALHWKDDGHLMATWVPSSAIILPPPVILPP